MPQLAKPILRWAGSKQRLLPALLSRSPKTFTKYFEPFAGSATLFFALNPRRARLSDINVDLVNFYRQLKKGAARLHKATSKIAVNEVSYLRTRELFSEEEDLWKRAVYFWYLNRSCFNGLYRTNGSGIFNVPFGKKLPSMPSLELAEACASRLRKASICVSDYEETIDEAAAGDFIYVDPPYKRVSIRNRGEYGPGAMADTDIARLILAIQRASARGAHILLSYNADLSPYLSKWRHEAINGRFLISADPRKRHPILEYTSYNYPAESSHG